MLDSKFSDTVDCTHEPRITYVVLDAETSVKVCDQCAADARQAGYEIVEPVTM